jgi:2-polyprenyl-3-methyl-5-hydroxy-6-metoxy-1,4-benzoquinol methylase
MRLQERFNKTRKYEDLSLEEAFERVYMNEEFMMNSYLPGIFLSHFLWRHHYKQFLFHKTQFLPRLDSIRDKRFYEVGTGTGFYTLQLFRHDPRFSGYGIDISPYSRQFTANQVSLWGFEKSFEPLDRNIIDAQLPPLPCVQSIEVLEHLTDPQLFLQHLRKLLQPGGFGFIAAALSAPEVDHVYLYWTVDEIIEQLRRADFEVLDCALNEAYPGLPGEIVPKIAAFIVC